MKKVYGTSLSLSSFERGLWFDSDKRVYQPEGWGIRFNIVCGKMIRPVPKFWVKDTNPWKGDEPWFVIRIPFFIGPFLGVALGKFGFYIGFKTFKVTYREHSVPERYGKWMRPGEYGTEAEPATYLQLSATMRRTRWR